MLISTVPDSVNVRRAIDPVIAELRQREFSRLDRNGLAYLDYTGAALYPDSHIRSHHAFLDNVVLGNPHSASAPSQASSAAIDAARRATLEFLNADPAEYTVIFTANSSAAIKLVAESYPFDSRATLVLSTDNHNSVNGMAEYARRAGSVVRRIPLDDELRLDDAERLLEPARSGSVGLFAFPAQSNFSGVQHDLGLIDAAQSAGMHVLLDAAAFVPSNVLDLRAGRPDFITLSVYKICGFPTGVGALVARHDALACLRRPWFAGGTVDFVSVQNELHQLTSGPGAFEDGTPDYLSIAAIPQALAFLHDVGMERVHSHVMTLTAHALERLNGLAHPNGQPAVTIYGPRDTGARGGTVAFNLMTRDGAVIPYPIIEQRLCDAGIAVRGGCFCNPGAAERAFGFERARAREALLAASRTGFTIPRFAEMMNGAPVGALRASIGLATNYEDVDRMIDVLASCMT